MVARDQVRLGAHAGVGLLRLLVAARLVLVVGQCQLEQRALDAAHRTLVQPRRVALALDVHQRQHVLRVEVRLPSEGGEALVVLQRGGERAEGARGGRTAALHQHQHDLAARPAPRAERLHGRHDRRHWCLRVPRKPEGDDCRDDIGVLVQPVALEHEVGVLLARPWRVVELARVHREREVARLQLVSGGGFARSESGVVRLVAHEGHHRQRPLLRVDRSLHHGRHLAGVGKLCEREGVRGAAYHQQEATHGWSGEDGRRSRNSSIERGITPLQLYSIP